MKRSPVMQSALPAYPHRRGNSWALGLLALGSTAVLGVAPGNANAMKPPVHDCPGDLVDPGHEPPAAPEGTESTEGPQAEPCTIPEVGADPHATPEVHIRGDMVAPEPIDGDMPAVDGDMVVPEVEPEVEPEAEVVPAPPDHRIAGGMPAPGFEPTQQPQPGDQDHLSMPGTPMEPAPPEAEPEAEGNED